MQGWVKVVFMKRIVVLSALLLGLLPLARSQGVGVSAELSLEQKQLLPDEKMHLKLSIRNRSGQDLRLGTESNWISFTVQGEKNVPVRQLGADHDFVEGETNVPAGALATREFNLTPYFDFREPGSYTVKATIKFSQWGEQEIRVPPVAFTIIKGIRLANLPEIGTEVGVPFLRGEAGQPPEVRRYFLERTDVAAGMKLYVRLTDGTGAQTKRLVAIGPYFSYSPPEVKLDRFNDLHVLHQIGSKDFNYCVIDTLGQILERQTYRYIDGRPGLIKEADGGVRVVGGARVVSDSDLPPPQK